MSAKNPNFTHGVTTNGYTNHHCRCDACCAAWKHYQASHYTKTKAATLARTKAYQKANREALNKARQARRKTSPSGIRERDANEARRRKAPYTSEALDFVAILKGDPCSYCGTRPAGTVDHIVPIVSGGTGDWDNLAAACQPCNSVKHTKPLLHFLLERC